MQIKEMLRLLLWTILQRRNQHQTEKHLTGEVHRAREAEPHCTPALAFMNVKVVK